MVIAIRTNGRSGGFLLIIGNTHSNDGELMIAWFPEWQEGGFREGKPPLGRGNEEL
jgi:hypothetical protein